MVSQTLSEPNLADCPQWLIDLCGIKDDGYEPSNKYLLLGSGLDVVPFNGKRLDAKQLWSYANRLDLGLKSAELMGMRTDGIVETGCGKAFKCVIPGHYEKTPSASLCVNPNTGQVMYRDWHGVDGQCWYSLAQVRASLGYGYMKRLSGPELATWQIRLLVETGLLAPVEVSIKRLPRAAKVTTRQVYDGFKLLLGCKWRYSPNDPTPFSRKFAGAWCGVSEATAGRAIAELQMQYKCIRIVSQHGYLRLWAPVREGLQ